MPNSVLQQAARAFVRVLLAVARVYDVALTVNRDASEKDLLKAYKRVALKAHPDKGGSSENFKTLQERGRSCGQRDLNDLLVADGRKQKAQVQL